MSGLGRTRLWLTRLVALGALAATVHGAVEAVMESRARFRHARRHALESLEFAQDRLFGPEYMASVRAVRRAIDLTQTVFFVDGRQQDGSTYFALFHLAPRRLVRFGRVGDPMRRAAKGPNRDARLIVLIPSRNAPLELVDVRDLSPGPKRARQARP